VTVIGVRKETVERIARELLGIDMDPGDLERVLPAVAAWQERFALVETLELDWVVEPVCLGLSGGN
jgi:hypothetical protein